MATCAAQPITIAAKAWVVDQEKAESYASRVARALLIIVFLVLWFLPLMIATMYKLPHQGRIAVLSVALGWTGAAWLAALVIVVGGAIRATEPPAPGTRTWPDSLIPARARAADSTQSSDSTESSGRTWPSGTTRSREPSQAPERPSFPAPARSPWPGSDS
jgi:T4 superinfection immunity protein